MEPSHRVIITSEALNDIDSIFTYIAKHSAENAKKLVRRLIAVIDSLELMPERFKSVGYSRTRQTRIHAVVARPYLIYYRVDDAARSVFVLTVRHGAREQPSEFD